MNDPCPYHGLDCVADPREGRDFDWVEPHRIQRRRSKGWRMPDGAIYVGRPTRWGNPFKIRSDHDAAACVAKYRVWVLAQPDLIDAIRSELSGHDLVCWCSLAAPCHADVLLELANG